MASLTPDSYGATRIAVVTTFTEANTFFYTFVRFGRVSDITEWYVWKPSVGPRIWDSYRIEFRA